jgi:hypothetical protein
MAWDTTIVELSGRFWWNTWCEVREIELTGWSATREDAVEAVGVAIDEACAPTPIQGGKPSRIEDVENLVGGQTT